MSKVTKRDPQATQEKVRLRLMVIIPLSFSFFTLAVGYLSFNLGKYFFIDTSRPAPLDTEGDFWILLAILVMTGLATVSGIAITRTITTPLKRLSSRAETLVPGRATMTQVARPAPSNEFDLLSHTLEDVFDYLESIKREGKHGEPSGAMTTSQYPAKMELIRQWLRQADQMAGLGTMAAGIAHEIRNPLASVRGLTELIREETSSAAPHKIYAEKVIKEVDRMNALVEEVLEFAQVEATYPTPQDVNRLLKEALSSIKYRFPNQKLEVVERLTDNLPPVLVRPEKLTRAFENLILNAFEATPEGGRVTITSSRGDSFASRGKASGKVSLRFHNTGSFIPPEEAEQIFLPFYTTKPYGTGLGLPITHRIISSQGGQISVDSDREKGTTFIVELPTYLP
ncbi:MAG: ATP-binding protein [Candidatus Brocadiaceae bacterium]|nr:ATP-binding protein [Candidatus Brocadiaceae bacterium]